MSLSVCRTSFCYTILSVIIISSIILWVSLAEMFWKRNIESIRAFLNIAKIAHVESKNVKNHIFYTDYKASKNCRKLFIVFRSVTDTPPPQPDVRQLWFFHFFFLNKSIIQQNKIKRIGWMFQSCNVTLRKELAYASDNIRVYQIKLCLTSLLYVTD